MSQEFRRRAILGALAALCLLGGMTTAALAQVRIGIGVGIAVPGARIGINIPAYPDLVPVPGYPVYYAPQLDFNLFFYDGYYWLFTGEDWYSSTWYNGPWYLVPPEQVPDFILRIPVGFYRHPPLFFRYWNRNAPPRWGEHWGPHWRRRRPDWDRWNRRAVPPRSPLPRYQMEFPRGRYPGPTEQRQLQNRYYRYPQPGNAPRERPMPPPRERSMPPPRYEQRRTQPPQQQRKQEQQKQREREHHPGNHPPG